MLVKEKVRNGCGSVCDNQNINHHVLLKLLPGCFRQTACWFGSRQLTLCPPQPLKELLQLTMETFSLHRTTQGKSKTVKLRIKI